MGVKSINVPNFDKIKSDTDMYIYATFLKPGYHKVLIYDPAMDRAFCKDFIVGLNDREDIFPEFPVLEGMVVKKRVQWIWRKWVPDKQDDIILSFKKDQDMSNNFFGNRLIKNIEDL